MADRPRIPARPTKYKGVQMRSRLEARFAGILDEVGVEDWEYEGDAYASGTRQYLPDFTVPAWGIGACWYIELKPYIEDPDALFAKMRVILDSHPWHHCADAVLAIASPTLGDFFLAERHPWARGRDTTEGTPTMVRPVRPEYGVGCLMRGWADPDDGEVPIVLPVCLWGEEILYGVPDALESKDAPVHLDWSHR